MRLAVFAVLLGSGMAAGQDPVTKPAEVVTVEASRIHGNTVDAGTLPQATIVITRRDIERSAAGTVYELLSARPEIVFYDQVGNGKEGVIDLRGFNEGTAAAVFLDGVRINEPDDNRSLLMQIPLDLVDRIEIFKGSSSTVLGGGALSGAIRIYTDPDRRGGRMAVKGGSFSTGGVLAELARGSYNLAAGYERGVGFRENSDAIDGWIRAGGRRVTSGGSLGGSYSYVDTRFGSPGALTREEMEVDRHAAPFNRVDENTAATHLLSADILHDFSGWTASGNVFLRRNDSDALTTGRSAALYGGFATDSTNTSTGTTVQLTVPVKDTTSLTAGAELTWLRLDADGFFTDVDGDRTGLASSTSTGENWQGLFAQVESSAGNHLTLVAGLRYDRQAIDFDDRQSHDQEARTFDKATYKLGASYGWAAGWTTFANYGTAFQTPTIIDLFAYPTFFSNPDLRPSTASTFEVGQRFSRGAFRGEISAYDLKVDDEVVFIITDPLNFIGRNENAGESRRRGVDITGAWTGAKTEVRAAYTFMRARFLTGDFDGNLLVMVPEQKVEISASRQMSERVRLDGRLLHTGSQYVLGDEMNSLDRLPAYTTLDLKVTYAARTWKLEGTVRNLLNREYETRGITNGFDTYFTPAPKINGYVTATYAF